MATSLVLRKALESFPSPIRHVLRAQDFNREMILALFQLTDMLERGSMPFDIMNGRALVWFGNEASSRTFFSFSRAALDLGGSMIPLFTDYSSQKKGESLDDTIVTLSTIGPEDVIVLRHPDEDAISRAALVSKVPVINAGSGKEQHPTQALLDAYTIFKALGRLDDFSIALVGDLKYGRTTNSLSYLLTKFTGIKMYLVSRDALRMKGDLRYYLHKHEVDQGRIEVVETSDFQWIVDKVDIIYQTRAQKERSGDAENGEHEQNPPYIIDRAVAERMKEGAKIMHPWPRNNELSREIDPMPQEIYIEQMYFGRLIRRALLALICHHNPIPR